MRKKLYTILMAGIFTGYTAEAKIIHLLPRPHQIEAKTSETAFKLKRDVSITDITNNKALVRFFEESGCTIKEGANAKVFVKLVDTIDGAYDYELADFPNESYILTIGTDEIHITAITETGVIRAAQTLRQLAEGYEGTPELEALTMKDWSAFKLRGFMHDVGRSFISVEEIKKELDLLSHFKVNTFHWHLTENQAWRFEVKAYPQLTSSASMVRFPGSYYTQEQCKEIDAYAAERGIIVIPEIDMPGHSGAFERAMGHSMQTAQGVTELLQILEEAAAVFPHAPYIHIGADEVAITYPNFLKTMIDKVHSLGKKVVVWNPVKNISISKDMGVDMTQMWSSNGKKISGIPNIDCRYNYTNHFDVFADLVGIYKSNIYYQDKGSADVAGFISAAWTDRKTPAQDDIIRQNNIYANILASTERAWIGGGRQYIEEGGTMLPNSGDEYDEFTDWERRFLFHKDHSLKNEPIPYVKQTNVRWRITDAFPNGGNADLKLPPEMDGLKDSYTYNGSTYGTGMATGAGIYLRHTWGNYVPTYFSNPQVNTTAYAWTYVYSPTARTVGAFIEFQNYGRSESDQAPNAGRWDRKGSRLYVNDKEVMPPVWDNTGKSINAEVDLKNENFSARPPLSIELKEGWNKVLMKLPYNPTSGVRLSKWMFTFVLTDSEGRNALDNVIYSPNQCLDDNAEQVAATISEIKKYRNNVIGAEPGYYSKTYAAELDAKIIDIEATLQEDLPAEDRALQGKALQEALSEFKTKLQSGEFIKPTASTPDEIHAYRLSTPLRDNRYPTSKGPGAEIIGETVPTNNALWKFVKRTDESFDIVNISDNTYISSASNNNTALRTVAIQPSTGWTLKPADEVGFFIITSGSVQFNQTNSGNGFKVFNWGSGTNITDSGCKYRIASADVPDQPVETPDPVLTLTNIAFDGTTPYRVSDELAEDVLAASILTTVIDYTQSEYSEVAALVGATNTQAPDSFCAITSMGGNRYGIRYNDNGGWYTQGATTTGRHQMVIVTNKDEANYHYFLDRVFGRDVTGLESDFRSFNTVSGKDALYLGGLVTSDNTNKYPLIGTIHSVRFYNTALNQEQIAALTYEDLIPTKIQSQISDNEVQVINGHIVCNRPYKVYTTDGRFVSTSTPRSAGLYILKADEKVKKIIIK